MKKSILVKLIGEAMREWPLYVISVVSTIAYLVLEMVMRLYTGQVIDAIGSGDLFYRVLLIAVLAPILASPFHTSSMLTKFRMSGKVLTRMRIKVGEKSTRISPSTLEEQGSGRILAHIGDELNEISHFVGYGLSMLTTLVTWLFGTFYFMAIIDMQLTLILYATALIVFPVSLKLSKPLTANEENKRKAFGAAQRIANEGFSAVVIIKSFLLEKWFVNRYTNKLKDVVQAEITEAKVWSAMSATGTILGYIPSLVLVVVGVTRIMSGTITLGQLVSLYLVSMGLVGWLVRVPEVFKYIRKSIGAGRVVYGFLELPEETGGIIFKPTDMEAVVEFDDVSFSYAESDTVLHNFSMKIKKGERVALVGASGSGKSTVLKLICGFITPKDGKANIFGNAISDWNMDSLRDNIALVSQDSYLFPGTLRQNLLSAKADASDEELLRVCKDAGVYDFVAENGLDYELGERGANVSGGERQRLSIARAMLKNAPLLLLDEPTSALDSKSEQIVQNSLELLMSGKTTLVVAHRLSTIKNADRIFVMDGGRVVAVGSHQQLVHDCPAYKTLYQRQILMNGDESDVG